MKPKVLDTFGKLFPNFIQKEENHNFEKWRHTCITHFWGAGHKHVNNFFQKRQDGRSKI